MLLLEAKDSKFQNVLLLSLLLHLLSVYYNIYILAQHYMRICIFNHSNLSVVSYLLWLIRSRGRKDWFRGYIPAFHSLSRLLVLVRSVGLHCNRNTRGRHNISRPTTLEVWTKNQMQMMLILNSTGIETSDSVAESATFISTKWGRI